MFDRQYEFPIDTTQVEVAVTEGPEVAAAAKRLSTDLRAALSGVVDEDDGEVELALEISDEGEKFGDLRASFSLTPWRRTSGSRRRSRGLRRRTVSMREARSSL